MSDTTSTVIEDPYEDDDEYEDDDRGPGRFVAIAVVIALALGVAGYFAGHASAGGGGPATLAEAVQQAADGKLACGETPAAPADAAPQGGAPGAGGNPSAFLVRAVCARGDDAAAGGGFGQGRAGGARAGGRFGGGLLGGPGATTGQVQSVSGSTLTLTGPNGETTVKLSPGTAVTKTAKGAKGDLKAGDTVVVSGTGQNGENPATSVFILPTAQGRQ